MPIANTNGPSAQTPSVPPSVPPSVLPYSNGVDPMTGLPTGPQPTAEPEVETINATKIGRINGKDMYRGQNGLYYYEKPEKKPAPYKLVVSTNAAPTPAPAASSTAASRPAARPELPSMVGRPAPR